MPNQTPSNDAGPSRGVPEDGSSQNLNPVAVPRPQRSTGRAPRPMALTPDSASPIVDELHSMLLPRPANPVPPSPIEMDPRSASPAPPSEGMRQSGDGFDSDAFEPTESERSALAIQSGGRQSGDGFDSDAFKPTQLERGKLVLNRGVSAFLKLTNPSTSSGKSQSSGSPSVSEVNNSSKKSSARGSRR